MLERNKLKSRSHRVPESRRFKNISTSFDLASSIVCNNIKGYFLAKKGMQQVINKEKKEHNFRFCEILLNNRLLSTTPDFVALFRHGYTK